MKLKALIALTALLVASEAQAAKPKYTLGSSEIYGTYEQLNTDSCTDEQNRPCPVGAIKKVDGKIVLDLVDYNAQIPVRAKDGVIVFKWDNPEQGDCDDPGCYNLLGITGLISPAKKGNKWIPTLKMMVKKDYPFPDEEGAPEGGVIEIERGIKR